MQKTIIFDFDGTIADSIPNNEQVLKIFNQIADENNFKNTTMEEIEKLRDVRTRVAGVPLQKVPSWTLKPWNTLRTTLASPC